MREGRIWNKAQMEAHSAVRRASFEAMPATFRRCERCGLAYRPAFGPHDDCNPKARRSA